MSEQKLYNVSETGKLLGIGRNKVYELISNGHLKAMDLGGMKISDVEIDRFISCYTGYSFKDITNVSKLVEKPR